MGVSVSSEAVYLSMSKEKIKEEMIRNVIGILSKIERVESPQSRALSELFGMFRSEMTSIEL